MTIYPYMGICSNPDGEGFNFPMASPDERCNVDDCDCTPKVFVPYIPSRTTCRVDDMSESESTDTAERPMTWGERQEMWKFMYKRERDRFEQQRDEARTALAGMVDLYRHPDSGRLIVEAGASPTDDALIAACAVLDDKP